MLDAPARSVTETVPPSAPEPPAPRWSFGRCLGFRFACVYLVLYSFPFPIGFIPGTGPIATAYEVFVGGAEALGGFLVLFRRATALGSFVVLAVRTNWGMHNFCYAWPFKLSPTHLPRMPSFLPPPAVPRLADFFLFHRPTR